MKSELKSYKQNDLTNDKTNEVNENNSSTTELCVEVKNEVNIK